MRVEEKDWYEIEYTRKSEDDWSNLGSVDPANTLVDIRIRLIRWIERIHDTDDYDYRIVHKVLTTDVVLVVRDEKDLTAKKE